MLCLVKEFPGEEGNAFSVCTTCDVTDLKAVLTFLSIPLKRVFCDILSGILDAHSHFQKRLWKWR
jgi:hypothetical protein